MSTDQQRADDKVTGAEGLIKDAATRTGGFLVSLLARTRDEGKDIWAEAQSISRSRPSPQPTAVSEPSASSAVEPVFSLPLVGATTVEDGIFYTTIGAVAIVGFVSWPTAALIGTGHAVHQRARNVTRVGTVGEAREGLIEALDDVV